jgi:hypothetical protein
MVEYILPRCGGFGGMDQIMYIHVSKCKNDKIKFLKKKKCGWGKKGYGEIPHNKQLIPFGKKRKTESVILKCAYKESLI